MLTHHRHDHDRLADIIERLEATGTIAVVKRGSSATASSTSSADGADHTCAANDDSQRCQKPVGTQALPIGLGVGIPLGIAVIVLIFLHFRHVRRLKKEEEQDKGFDMDMDDYDPRNAVTDDGVQKPTFGSYPNGLIRPTKNFGEKQNNHAGSIRSGYDTINSEKNPENPFYAAPYIMNPELAGSTSSLNDYLGTMSLYENEHHKYPSNASIRSVPRSPSSPQLPSPAVTRDQVSSRQSSNSSRPNLNVDPTMIHPHNTALHSPLGPGPQRSIYSRRHSASSTSSSTTDDRGYDQRLHKIDTATTDRKLTPPEGPFADPVEEFNFSPSGTPTEGHFPHHESQHDNAHWNDNDDFVIADEQDEMELVAKRTSGTDLARSATKRYERVKSVYNEYMSPEQSPVTDTFDDTQFGELPSRNAPHETHIPPKTLRTSVVGELPSRTAPAEHHEPPPGFDGFHQSAPSSAATTERSTSIETYPTPPDSFSDHDSHLPASRHVISKEEQEQLRQQQQQQQQQQVQDFYPTPPLHSDQKRMSPPHSLEHESLATIPDSYDQQPVHSEPELHPRHESPVELYNHDQQHEIPMSSHQSHYEEPPRESHYEETSFYDDQQQQQQHAPPRESHYDLQQEPLHEHQQHEYPHASQQDQHNHLQQESVYDPHYYPSNPDEPFMHLAKQHLSNGSAYSGVSDDRPFPPSVSQQNFRPPQKLPKLTSLASPHALDEYSSPIAFAPKQNHKKAKHLMGAASPIMSSPPSMPSTPSASAAALPTPSSMRQSIVMMDIDKFAPKKKYVAANTRPGPMESPPQSAYGFPAGAQYNNPQHRRVATPVNGSALNSELIPGAKDNDMLRPTMNMRS